MIGALVSILGGWRAAAFAALAFAACTYASIQTVRLHRSQLALVTIQRDAAKAQADAQAAARKAEQDMAQAVADADAQYERGKQDAQATADRVAADLRAGTLRLRREWAQCETGRLSAGAAAARELGEAEQQRIESAGRIVRAAAECDAHTAALIQAYNAAKEVTNGTKQ